MDNFLTVNQVASRLDLVQQLWNVRVPRVECVVGESTLLESNHATHSVDSRMNSLVDDHITDFNFRTILGNSHQLAQPRKFNLRVVFLENSNVMLDDLTHELDEVQLSMFSLICLERSEFFHCCFNFLLVKRNQLSSQKLFDVEWSHWVGFCLSGVFALHSL